MEGPAEISTHAGIIAGAQLLMLLDLFAVGAWVASLWVCGEGLPKTTPWCVVQVVKLQLGSKVEPFWCSELYAVVCTQF